MTDVLGCLRVVGRRRGRRTTGAGRPGRDRHRATSSRASRCRPGPSRHRRLDAEEADRLALPGWPPVESEPLGDWVLRASGGFSSRGNSVLALGDPGDAARRRRGAGGRRGTRPRSLAPRAHVHPEEPTGGGFAAAGWSTYEAHLLMLASVPRVLRRLEPATASAEVHHSRTVDEGWLASDERAARYGEPARRVLEAGRGHLRDRARRGGDRARARPGRPSTATGWAVSSAVDPARSAGPGWAPRCCARCWSGAPSAAPRRRYLAGRSRRQPAAARSSTRLGAAYEVAPRATTTCARVSGSALMGRSRLRTSASGSGPRACGSSVPASAARRTRRCRPGCSRCGTSPCAAPAGPEARKIRKTLMLNPWVPMASSQSASWQVAGLRLT